jgi:hypothetical protein
MSASGNHQPICNDDCRLPIANCRLPIEKPRSVIRLHWQLATSSEKNLHKNPLRSDRTGIGILGKPAPPRDPFPILPQ